MKVLPIGAVKHADAIVGVLAGMTVHNVNEHDNAQPVGLVHQGFQLVRASKPTTGLHQKWYPM